MHPFSGARALIRVGRSAGGRESARPIEAMSALVVVLIGPQPDLSANSSSRLRHGSIQQGATDPFTPALRDHEQKAHEPSAGDRLLATVVLP